MSSEKVSFNISVVDLGKIHMLVDKGVYTNRTDFITKAILNELNRNEDVIEQTKDKHDFAIGIMKYSRDDVEKMILNNKKMTVHVLGMLILDKTVDLELAKSAFNKIVVFGKYMGPNDVKEHFEI